jgi:hypothetical protein
MKAKLGVIRPLAAIAVLLAVVMAVAQWDTAKAGGYSPTSGASVSDATAGATADVTTEFGVPVPDYNYAEQTVTFTPSEFGQVTAGVPLGAMAGQLDAQSTLGLLNNVCITNLPVHFDLMNASIDTTDTISFDDGFADLDGNGLPDAVDKYPDFLVTMFPGVTPVSRAYGQTSVAGTPVSMNFLSFAPGTSLPGYPAFEASLGSLSLSVLNDPTAPLAPGSITDFCTPLSSITTFFGVSKDNPDTAADESGIVLRTNPTAGGDYTFTSYSRSRPDADNDGYENYLDTCPYDVNEGDPRVQGSGDNDMDGIDNVCDPTPDEANQDQDNDVYLNRGDDCPLDYNPDNADSDGDDIGDACDRNAGVLDGESIQSYVEAVVTITGGAAAETPTPAETPAATPTAAATPAATPTTAATPKATPTVAPTPKPTPTVVPTPAVVPTAVPVQGGGGLLGSGDGGFSTWAACIVGVAAVLMLGGIGTAATAVWRRRR